MSSRMKKQEWNINEHYSSLQFITTLQFKKLNILVKKKYIYIYNSIYIISLIIFNNNL